MEEFGPASQAELSARTGTYRSDMVSVVSELADQGLVERAPDPADRRRNVVTPTRSGRRQLLKLDKLLARVEDEVLAPLTPTQREQLTRLLVTLVDHHGGRGRCSPPGDPSRSSRPRSGVELPPGDPPLDAQVEPVADPADITRGHEVVEQGADRLVELRHRRLSHVRTGAAHL